MFSTMFLITEIKPIVKTSGHIYAVTKITSCITCK